MTGAQPPSHEGYAALVGTTFTADIEPAGTVALELVGCSALVTANGWQSYSLSFRGHAATPLGQGTYIFTVDGLEPLAIFIVPVRADAHGVEYEAHFTMQEG